MLKFFTVLASVVVLGSTWAAWTGLWTDPGVKRHEVPKNVRSNPGSFRSHYTVFHTYGSHGGK